MPCPPEGLIRRGHLDEIRPQAGDLGQKAQDGVGQRPGRERGRLDPFRAAGVEAVTTQPIDPRRIRTTSITCRAKDSNLSISLNMEIRPVNSVRRTPPTFGGDP